MNHTTSSLTSLLTAAVLTSGIAAQATLDGRPYGHPSECFEAGPETLSLTIHRTPDAAPTLRLEGGVAARPVTLVFSTSQSDTAMPGGGTMFVGPAGFVATGMLDAEGRFELALDGVRFGENDELFVQGLQVCPRGLELSAGLRLVREHEQAAPPEVAPTPPDEILVEEFGDLLKHGAMEAAIATALNSEGDELTLAINGAVEVPVFTGISAGGKAAFTAKIQRVEVERGAVYDLRIGQDVAASASVGVGVAGVSASAGVGGDMIWRFESPQQVARAIRSMLILKAVNGQLETACLAIDTQIARIDRGIRAARGVIDYARRAVRSWMPWRNLPIVRRMQRRMDAMRAQRRALADKARKTAAKLIHWVAKERMFLTKSIAGFEFRKTIEAGVSAGLSFDSKDASGTKTGSASFMNLGISGACGLQRQLVTTTRFDRKTGSVSYENKMSSTKAVTAAAGIGIGGSVSGQRVLALSQTVTVDKGGVETDKSGTTVSLALDGKLAGALGIVATAQAGVGGEVQVEMRLRDLLAFGQDTLSILVGDDDGKLLRVLRAVPIKISACGRYEAGVALGFGVEVTGVCKFDLGASAMMIDRGESWTYEGGSSTEQFVTKLSTGLLPRNDRGLATKLEAVKREVAHVVGR